MAVPVSADRFVLLGVVGAAAMAVVSGQVGALSAFPTDQFLAHWWVFPAAVLFSTIALSSGVSGALFFSPFFMLVVGLTPSQAGLDEVCWEQFATGTEE